MFDIFRTDNYEKKLDKSDNKERQILIDFEAELTTKPYRGKPLNNPFLREKKFDGKRALFIIDDNLCRILFITITTKNDQKEVIRHILNNIEIYKEELRRGSL